MKAVFLTFSRGRHRSARHNHRFSQISPKAFLAKYGVSVFLTAALISGIVFGAVCEKNADENLAKGLDFLFTTNLNERLSQNFIETFCACFASDFIFTAVVFLLGITPWGMAVLPAVMFFKGFGTGLSGGFLVGTHLFMGFLFYVVVLLPGIFIFCLMLICQGNLAFYTSKRIFCIVFKGAESAPLSPSSTLYLHKSLIFLAVSLGCAVLDTLLWCMISPLFGFG